MEGYSVTEAASILGVPTERVWELLARGVLSGAPEGDTGMRVYLQPRPAPAPPAAEAGRPNGDGGPTEQRELSPFRELLTEFRNLTERYGQALLALGEARGEVAALRSRVDLLEARMDLRLPMAPGALTDPGWGSGQMERAATRAPEPARPDREPPRPVPQSEEGEAPEDGHDRPSGRRRSGQRRATEAFAEALARADDPTRPELPGAAETAAAMAALHDHGVAEAQETQAEAILPRELPAADSIPSSDEVGPEPAAQDRTEGEPTSQAEAERPMVDEPQALEPAATEPSPGPEEPAELESPAVEVSPPVEDTTEAVVLMPEPVSIAEPEAANAEHATEDEADEVAGGTPVTGNEPAPPPPEEAAVSPPIDWDPDRYTVAIEEPDWFAGEVASEDDGPREESGALPTIDDGRKDGESLVEAEVQAEAAPEPEAEERMEGEPEPPQESDEAAQDGEDAAQPEPEAPAPEIAAVSAAEETMLWFGRAPEEPVAAASTDEGADEMEVAGGGTGVERRPMPGSRELDDALAALDALARRTEPRARPEPEPTAPPQREPEPVPEPIAPPPAATWPATDAPVGRGQDPWIPAEPPRDRASVTPASRAYRRLRRIFPG